MSNGKFHIACLAMLAAVIGCNSSSSPSAPPTTATGEGGTYQIVVTTGMVADIVRQVAGDKATVVGLMGEGVDPHQYKPTRGDVKQLSEADVIFYSGLLLEGRMADQFTKLARSGKPVFAVTERIAEESEDVLIHPADDEAHADPHLWMDVSLWSQCVGQVADALAEYDEANADYYHANAKAYQEELSALDDYAKQTIASIPDDQRVLITAHDAFGYFSRAYNIPVMSIQGISTESEAGVDDINRLVDAIVSKKIGAMFVERQRVEQEHSSGDRRLCRPRLGGEDRWRTLLRRHGEFGNV